MQQYYFRFWLQRVLQIKIKMISTQETDRWKGIFYRNFFWANKKLYEENIRDFHTLARMYAERQLSEYLAKRNSEIIIVDSSFSKKMSGRYVFI